MEIRRTIPFHKPFKKMNLTILGENSIGVAIQVTCRGYGDRDDMQINSSSNQIIIAYKELNIREYLVVSIIS